MDGRGCIEVRDIEVVNLWCTVGASEDLATDADVTRFLLAVYFADSSDGKKHAVRCAVCKSSLTPLCYTCRSGLQQPKQSVSSQTSSSADHENLLWVKTEVVRNSEERVGTDTGVFREKGGSRQSKKPVSSTITTFSGRGRSRTGLSDPSAGICDAPKHLSTNKPSLPPFTVHKYDSDDQDDSGNAFEADGDQSEMDVDRQANDVRSSQSSTKRYAKRYADRSASEKSSSDPSGVKKFKTLKGSAPETDHPQRSPTKSAFGKGPFVLLTRCDGASPASTAVPPHERRASLACDKVSTPLCGTSSSRTDLQPQEPHLPRSLEQIYHDLESVLTVRLDSLFDESQTIQLPQHCRIKRSVATFDQYWSGKHPLALGRCNSKPSHHFCQDCNSVFEDKIDFKEHTQTEGACAKDPSRPVDERSKQILTRVMEKYLHCCHDCKLVFSHTKYLKGHLDTHSGSSVDDAFVMANRSRETINKKLRQDFDSFMGFTTGKYPVMGETVTYIRQKMNSRNERKVHVYYENYSCSLCQKVFKLKADLRLHMTRPTCEGEDPPMSLVKKQTTLDQLPIHDVTVKGKRRSAQAVRNYLDLFMDDTLHDPNDMVSYAPKEHTSICHDAQEKDDSDFADPPLSMFRHKKRDPVLDEPRQGKNFETVCNYSDGFTEDSTPDPNNLVAVNKSCVSREHGDTDAGVVGLEEQYKDGSAVFGMDSSSAGTENGLIHSLTDASAEVQQAALDVERNSKTFSVRADTESSHGVKGSRKIRKTRKSDVKSDKRVSGCERGRKQREDQTFDPSNPDSIFDTFHKDKIQRTATDRFMTYYKYEKNQTKDPLTLTKFMKGKHSVARIKDAAMYSAKKSHYYCHGCNKVFSIEQLNYYMYHHTRGKTKYGCPSFKGVPPQEELDAESVDILKQVVDELLHCCPLCDRVFVTDLAHKDHLLEHTRCESEHDYSTSDAVYKCTLCGETFPAADGILHHLTLPKGKRKCLTCGELFVTRCQKNSHIATHPRPKPPKPPKPTTKKCRQCGEKIPSHQMNKHRKTAHKVVPSLTFLCTVCGKALKSEHRLKDHLSCAHSEERPFSCFCGKSFKLKQRLAVHKKTHHDGQKPFKCKFCVAVFRSNKFLKAHLRNIHIVCGHFQCEICMKKFLTREQLSKHMRRHTKPFECGYCYVSFATKAELHVHTRLHTGEKPFHCSQCPRKFGRRDYLKKHELVHTGHMPYSCSDCEKKFRQCSSYKLHRQKYHPESLFPCKHCGQTFATPSGLDFHVKVMHKVEEAETSAVHNVDGVSDKDDAQTDKVDDAQTSAVHYVGGVSEIADEDDAQTDNIDEAEMSSVCFVDGVSDIIDKTDAQS